MANDTVRLKVQATVLVVGLGVSHDAEHAPPVDARLRAPQSLVVGVKEKLYTPEAMVIVPI